MKKCVIFCLLPLILASCGTVHDFTIDVQKPAQLTLPTSVQNLAIADNAAIQPADYGHKTVKNGVEESVIVSSDSLNLILVQAFAQFIDEQGFYASVLPYENSLRPDAKFMSELPIDTLDIARIVSNTNADGVVSLDRLILDSKLVTRNIEDGLTSDLLQVNMNAKFRVYYNDGVLISPPILFEDSLYWESIRHRNTILTEKLPSREDALRQSVIFIADKMATMFAPFWQDQIRWYYSEASTNMKKAAVYAADNKWSEAAAIWKEIYDSEKKVGLRAKLASNIAVANEMLDDLDNALSWAQISYDLFTSNSKAGNSKSEAENLFRIQSYLNELKKRVSDFRRLDAQEGIESETANE